MMMSRFLPSNGLKSLAIAMVLVSWLQACTPEDPVSLRDGSSDRSLVTQDEKDNPESKIIPGQYIVLLKEDKITNPVLGSRIAARKAETDAGQLKTRTSDIKMEMEASHEAMEMEMKTLLQSYNISVKNVRRHYGELTPGASMMLSESEAMALSRDERVLSVEPDRAVVLDVSTFIRTPFVPSDNGKGSSTVAYGVSRVGGSINIENSNAKASRWAWILDTGIDLDHEDLDVNTQFARNFTSDPSIDDRNGHGTHVAGIIAAKNNSIGTTGVAAGATVVPIKVINDQGEGTYSDIIAALNYLIPYTLSGDVINMSIGGPASNSLDKAVKKAAKYVKVVVAAGNSQNDANNYSPARVNYKNVFSIAATDSQDNLASYSNFGNNIDFAAPGSGILSTYKDNSYGILSGTSMAAPHVAGVFLISPYNYRSKGNSKGGNKNYIIIGHSGNLD